MEKELIIINKEKIYKKNGSFYCDNVDISIKSDTLEHFWNIPGTPHFTTITLIFLLKAIPWNIPGTFLEHHILPR